jgi:hypothetical protein
MLLVQNYLRSGKTLEDLQIEHGVYSNEKNDKVGFNYDQIEAKESDPLACQCRGLILRKDIWDIVACPMFRFFNMEQTGCAAEIDWESAAYEEKLDGSCIIVYWDSVVNKWMCATRGRVEADGGIDGGDLTFAMLVDHTCNKMRNDTTNKYSLQDLMDVISSWRHDAGLYTFVFELTSPLNRIVCKYNEEFLTLIAVRHNITLQEEDPKEWCRFGQFNIQTPKLYSFNNINHMVSVIREWNPEDHEGVVVKDKSFNRIKVKNPSYLAYNYLRTSLSTSLRGCIEVILLGTDDDVVPMMPKMIGDRILKLKPLVQQVLEITQKDYDELKHIENMKEFALEAQKKLWPAALFSLKRGKTPNLKTFAIGFKDNSAKIPGPAIESMMALCIKIDPKVAELI